MTFMTTLTLAEAKKNLGKWLTAATKGEEIAIRNGAQVIALKPMKAALKPPLDIRSFTYEYARREYGVTKKQFDRFCARLEAEHEQAKRDGTLVTITNPTLEKLEKAINASAPAAKAAQRPAKRGARTRALRAA
jgi:antitoxin (DNA-binding transcriptional repressor) of toxin-antitoxin stability system